MRTMSETSTVESTPTPLAETPDIYGAYPRLTDDQIATLEAGGTRRVVAPGETLIEEGKPSDTSSGARPRRFLGELGDLEGQASFFTAEAIEPGEVLVVLAQRVRDLVAHDPALST
jgi:thioredoxin reductase (NADPH)